MNGSKLTNLPEIVAKEVRDHQEFGLFFGGFAKFFGRVSVFFWFGKTRASSFDGASFDMVLLQMKEELGGGGAHFSMPLPKIG